MRLILVAAALLLTACVDAFAQLNAELPQFKGQDIHALINRLGYPAGQAIIAGDTVYTWSTSLHTEFTLPTTETTTGIVNGEQFYATTTGEETTRLHFHCMLQAATSANGIITSIHWHGNRGGCGMYARALGTVAKDY